MNKILEFATKEKKRLIVLVQIILIAAGLAIGGKALSEQYGLGINVFKDTFKSCMKERFYIVRKEILQPQDLETGGIYVFNVNSGMVRKAMARFEHGQRLPNLTKIVAARAGDHVRVTHDAVYINGEKKATRPLLPYLDKAYADGRAKFKPYIDSMDRELVGQEVFLMGEIESSYDSRYFGPVTDYEVTGEVIAKFL